MKPTSVCTMLMKNPYRPIVMLAVASCSWAHVTLGQDSGNAGTASGGQTSGAGETSGPFRTGASSGPGSSAKRSPFGYDSGDSGASQSPTMRKAADQAAETEVGSAGGGSRLESGDESDSNIVAPSFYGRGPQLITPGRGQFARPKFRYGGSVGVGYDDNPNQVSDVGVAGRMATPRNGSGFVWVNGHWDAQWIKPRNVFSINVEGGFNAYWDRAGDSTDFNARLGSLYVNKIDPRTQFTANVSLAYLAQPDYANFYASQTQVGGDYFTGSTKFDLSHRWTPHFSTATSVSVNLLQFMDSTQNALSNNFWDFIFGNEFRFNVSPRHTWVLEGRYSLQEYIDNTALNSQTALFLAGLDWQWTRRLSANFRAGAALRTFNNGGDNSSPYAEASLNYLASRHSSIVINGRYGYEQTNSTGDENLSYRLGILYQRAFTARIAGNLGFNFIHADFIPRAGAGSTSDVYDLNVGLQYRVDRHLSLGTRYSYTLQNTSSANQDFDRSRILFSGQYEY